MSVLPSGVEPRNLVFAEFVRMARTSALVSVSQSRITPSPLAVGRERQSLDKSGVSRQRVEEFTVRRVPDFNYAVHAAGNESFAVGSVFGG